MPHTITTLIFILPLQFRIFYHIFLFYQKEEGAIKFLVTLTLCITSNFLSNCFEIKCPLHFSLINIFLLRSVCCSRLGYQVNVLPRHLCLF